MVGFPQVTWARRIISNISLCVWWDLSNWNLYKWIENVFRWHLKPIVQLIGTTMYWNSLMSNAITNFMFRMCALDALFRCVRTLILYMSYHEFSSPKSIWILLGIYGHTNWYVCGGKWYSMWSPAIWVKKNNSLFR